MVAFTECTDIIIIFPLEKYFKTKNKARKTFKISGLIKVYTTGTVHENSDYKTTNIIIIIIIKLK